MDLVTGALGSVIPKLGELLKEEYELQTGVRKNITCLSRDLESMYAALRRVAEVPPDQLDDEVKLWARDVRELSYDVEDILDRFLVRVDGREARDPNRFKRAAKKIGKIFSKSKAHHQIGGMIKTINEQADMVDKRHRRYRAEDIVAQPAAKSTVDPRLEAMYKQVTQLVGIDEASAKLVSLLSPQQRDDESKMKMKVVSVVGTGGLGKTTLAKAVYDKLKVDFECTAFVPVGRDPDLKKVFRDLLIDLDKNKYMDPKYTTLDERQLINELREFLGSKKYFIVIDDVWKTETWKTIKYALVQNNNGSRVITTTRLSDVSDQAGEVYKLEPLPCDQSEKLFYTRIFGTNGTCPNNQLKEVSDKILNKCHGVPLAIITMASLLVGKTPEEWAEVCSSVFRDKGNRQGNQLVSDTEWILSLSYYDLPAHLKTCLLYLSAFPEDYLIDKKRLIWKWAAEGFVHNKEPGKTSLFEVGEGYFNDLINRSMIQAVGESDEDIVWGCRIHDMVLDLLRLKSQEENFVTISSSNIAEGTSPPSRVRRLANQDIMVEQTHQDSIEMDLRHVRTFIACRCDKVLSFQSFELLRVLDLEGCGDVNLEHVEKLLHLRYLGIQGGGPFELPEGIGALKFLQTVDFRLARLKALPSSLGQLTQLSCLHAGTWSTMVPNGVIEKLTSLEELQISISDNNMVRQFVKDLSKLRELRVLDACLVGQDGTDERMQSDLVESLGALHKIRHLNLMISAMDAEKAIWDAAVLPRPLRCLIVGPGTRFSVVPSCINSSDLPNLTRLELSVDNLDEHGLKILGALPELRHLRLRTSTTVTITTRGAAEGCFQKLRFLSLHGSAPLFVSVDDVALEGDNECLAAPAVVPNLQVLRFGVVLRELIRNKGSCGNLGLEYLPSLQKFEAQFLCYGVSADKVEKEEAALRHAIEAHPNRPTLEIYFHGKEETKSRPIDHDVATQDVGSSN